jgi:hypothetical protein
MTPCTGKDCPICAAGQKPKEKVIVKNWDTGSNIEIDLQDYANISFVADLLIAVSEEDGSFVKNNGYVWREIPLTNSTVPAILSVRKSITTGGDPEYQWMLKK